MNDTDKQIHAVETNLTHSESILEELEQTLNRFSALGFELSPEMAEMLDRLDSDDEPSPTSTTTRFEIPYFAIPA